MHTCARAMRVVWLAVRVCASSFPALICTQPSSSALIGQKYLQKSRYFRKLLDQVSCACSQAVSVAAVECLFEKELLVW